MEIEEINKEINKFKQEYNKLASEAKPNKGKKLHEINLKLKELMDEKASQIIKNKLYKPFLIGEEYYGNLYSIGLVLKSKNKTFIYEAINDPLLDPDIINIIKASYIYIYKKDETIRIDDRGNCVVSSGETFKVLGYYNLNAMIKIPTKVSDIAIGENFMCEHYNMTKLNDKNLSIVNDLFVELPLYKVLDILKSTDNNGQFRLLTESEYKNYKLIIPKISKPYWINSSKLFNILKKPNYNDTEEEKNEQVVMSDGGLMKFMDTTIMVAAFRPVIQITNDMKTYKIDIRRI